MHLWNSNKNELEVKFESNCLYFHKHSFNCLLIKLSIIISSLSARQFAYELFSPLELLVGVWRASILSPFFRRCLNAHLTTYFYYWPAYPVFPALNYFIECRVDNYRFRRHIGCLKRTRGLGSEWILLQVPANFK